MDEPFASLDAMTRNHLQEELMKLHQKEKVTVIFITHNIQEAVCLGTRILVMAKQGGIKMDVPNTIPKPVTPASGRLIRGKSCRTHHQHICSFLWQYSVFIIS